MVVWGGLNVAKESREAKGKGEKERYIHLNTELQRIASRVWKDFLGDKCQEIEWERLEISRKLEIKRERFMQRWA